LSVDAGTNFLVSFLLERILPSGAATMIESFEEILFKQGRSFCASAIAGRNINRAGKIMTSLSERQDDFMRANFD
jgi:hypothetical protein